MTGFCCVWGRALIAAGPRSQGPHSLRLTRDLARFPAQFCPRMCPLPQTSFLQSSLCGLLLPNPTLPACTLGGVIPSLLCLSPTGTLMSCPINTAPSPWTWLSCLEREGRCSTCSPETEWKGLLLPVGSGSPSLPKTALFPAPAPPPLPPFPPLFFCIWPPRSFISQTSEIKIFII